jgi:SAM-dependent methyltransferase
MNKNLADKAYWENYYSTSQVDADHIRRICGVYDAYWNRLVAACAYRPRSIIEIGAYPGRYLAYLAARYDLHAVALDYNADRSKIELAFAATGVKDYEILQADFLAYEPSKQYDLVLSNGFIEHFENYDEVLDRHCGYLAPGGAMLVMVPNKRYLRRWYGYLVDRANLKAHNLKAMRPEVFKDFAERNGLQIESLGYYGGFQCGVHQPLNLAQRIICRIFRMVFKAINPWIQNHPNRFLSSTIIAVFKKA